jgi:hypothetical protein
MPFVEFNNEPLNVWDMPKKNLFEHFKVEKKLIKQKRQELQFQNGLSKDKGKGKTKQLGVDNCKINVQATLPGRYCSPRTYQRRLALSDKQAINYKKMVGGLE